MAAREKAIWYEFGEKHRGTLYDGIPGLVIHGLCSLGKRMDELLYQTGDHDYNVYLDRHVKGVVEAELDGLALTRFREKIEKVVA